MKMKTAFFSVLGVLFLFIVIFLSRPCKAGVKDTGSRSRLRAVSLKVLQQKLAVCEPKGNCPKTIFQLVGLKKIVGYVADETNHDIILIGQVDATSPPLHLDDLVVALRNTSMKYAELRGHTYYYSNPGCSIDPNPKTVAKLQEIGNQVSQTQSPQAIKALLERWHTTCLRPQGVRVDGIPFDTHFAQIMIKADYDMKRIVDGKDTLDIPGFKGLSDMTLEKARYDIVKGGPISIHPFMMNRFWFFPGKNRYLEDRGVVKIDKCPVILLTEAEYLTKRGKITGKGRSNPMAKQFAMNFTKRYQQIAHLRPIYQELDGLFRFVALAKIMKCKTPQVQTGLSLDYLLNHYRVSPAHVERTLPGRSNVKQFEHRKDFAGGYTIVRFWLPSCGGVSIEIEPSYALFVKDKAERLSGLRKTVLETRPSPEALSWDLTMMWQVRLEQEKRELSYGICGQDKRAFWEKKQMLCIIDSLIQN